jgi:hypothetical protein
VGIRKISKIIKKALRNPVFFKDLYIYLKNDFFAVMGMYKYENHVLFIAGLPKSGTTWVQTQLARVPGYNIRHFHDPDNCTVDHNICEHVFLSLPKHGYSVLKLHTKYSEQNFKIIKKYVPKFVVMIRDLRDMCVSRYFHVKNEEQHPHYELYNRETLEDGMMHSMHVIEDEYVSWVKDWVDVAKNFPDMIMLIKYEELNSSPKDSFKKIFDFFNLPYDNQYLDTLSESKLRNEKDIKAELDKSVGLRTISTARKGIVGDWKNYFKDDHRNKFKEIAGELLIELGYEKNLNW